MSHYKMIVSVISKTIQHTNVQCPSHMTTISGPITFGIR